MVEIRANTETEVTVRLDRDRALVLFELLANLSDNKELDSLFDKAERLVLWEIEAELESLLAEPFDKNYHEILKLAKGRILNRH